jgi:hypothetical protein
MLRDLAYGRGNLVSIGEIKCPAFGLTAGLGNLLDDCRDTFSITIKDRNLSAFIGKQMSGRSSHAAGGSSDKSNFSSDRSTEFGESWHVFSLRK